MVLKPAEQLSLEIIRHLVRGRGKMQSVKIVGGNSQRSHSRYRNYLWSQNYINMIKSY